LCTNAPPWGREQQQEQEEEVALMRRIILLMTVAALVLVSALVVVVSAGALQHRTGETRQQQHPTKKVLIKNFRFSPAKITVKRGTRVVWINKDIAPHTATATNKPRSFDSGRLGQGERFSHTFRRVGKKPYYCEIHPDMRGRITVRR
jgi:plastocyanin